MYQKMQKAIAVLLLTPLIIVITTAIISVFVEEGVILQAWLSMVTKIPFGSAFGELSVNIFVEAFGMGYDMSQYVNSLQKITFLQILEDCCRLVLAALFYEAVNSFIQSFLGVWDKQKGLHNVLMKMASSMISIVLCTFIATWTTDFLYSQVAKLPNAAQGIISAIVSVILVAGAYGVATLVLGATVLGTIAFVGVNMIMLNILKVLASYVGMLLIILFLNEGAYLQVLATVSSWGVVIIMLVGVEILVTGIVRGK